MRLIFDGNFENQEVWRYEENPGRWTKSFPTVEPALTSIDTRKAVAYNEFYRIYEVIL